MSKERLEEIKRAVYINQDPTGVKIEKDILLKVIEQAERAQEMEGEIKSHAPEGKNYINKQYVDLLHENKRYREALEEIKELTRFDDGSKEKEHEIACEVLEGDQ